MNICVHTAPGRRGTTDPRVFFVGGHRLIVASIVARWITHPHRFFEVVCDDGRCFLLQHDLERRSWELAGVYAPRVRAPKLQLAGGDESVLQPRRWWTALRSLI